MATSADEEQVRKWEIFLDENYRTLMDNLDLSDARLSDLQSTGLLNTEEFESIAIIAHQDIFRRNNEFVSILRRKPLWYSTKLSHTFMPDDLQSFCPTVAEIFRNFPGFQKRVLGAERAASEVSLAERELAVAGSRADRELAEASARAMRELTEARHCANIEWDYGIATTIGVGDACTIGNNPVMSLLEPLATLFRPPEVKMATPRMPIHEHTRRDSYMESKILNGSLTWSVGGKQIKTADEIRTLFASFESDNGPAIQDTAAAFTNTESSKGDLPTASSSRQGNSFSVQSNITGRGGSKVIVEEHPEKREGGESGIKIGYALYLNWRFDDPTNPDKHYGSHKLMSAKVDEPRIRKQFSWLINKEVSFEANVANKKEVHRVVDQFKETLETTADELSFIMVILNSHGCNNSLLFTDNIKPFDLYEDVVWRLDWKFHGLSEIPRLYLINACRNELQGQPHKTFKSKNHLYCKSPYFILFATLPNEKSWAHPDRGSVFFRAILDEFKGNENLWTMLKEAQKKMDEYAGELPESRIQKMDIDQSQSYIPLMSKFKFTPVEKKASQVTRTRVMSKFLTLLRHGMIR